MAGVQHLAQKPSCEGEELLDDLEMKTDLYSQMSPNLPVLPPVVSGKMGRISFLFESGNFAVIEFKEKIQCQENGKWMEHKLHAIFDATR